MEFEVEVLAGLGDFAEAELVALGAVPAAATDTATRFTYAGPVRHLLSLRTSVAVYAVDGFAVPRPKGLLGEQHLTTIVRRIAQVRTLGSFASFRFSAAGRDSPVFDRLAREVAGRTGLTHDRDRGDLVLRVRAGGAGWEVLYRLSPRPLSARSWRLRDRPGALNASIAAAMATMTAPRPRDRVLNIACGTATLLIERLAIADARQAVGVDVDSGALRDASVNLAAAGTAGKVQLVRADIESLPLPAASFDVLTADLPYGTTMGSPAGNERLYPMVLEESARVARPGARFVVITHDIRRFETVVASSSTWDVADVRQVFQKGHHPKIWRLHRRP